MEAANTKLGAASEASDSERRESAEWIPLLVLPTAVSLFRAQLAPWQFMWLLSLAIFFGCKWQTWFCAIVGGSRSTFARNTGYLFLWPGMDARAFLSADRNGDHPRPRNWFAASVKSVAGCTLIWLAARSAPNSGTLVTGWTGMIGLVLLLHFGIFHLLALAWRTVGVNAQPIMQAPIHATSLREFWGKRWNLGFRQLTHALVFEPLHRRFGLRVATLAAFFVSGLIHDLVISFPARGGYGLPTTYFLLQGIGVLAERSKFGARLGLGQGFRGRLFALLCAAAPAFWLFHPPFVRNVMLPFFAWLGLL